MSLNQIKPSLKTVCTKTSVPFFQLNQKLIILVSIDLFSILVCQYFKDCEENDVWKTAISMYYLAMNWLSNYLLLIQLIILAWNILSGLPVENGEHPHMAAIGYTNQLNDTEFNCGGFIVSKDYVMTAAHCCSDEKAKPTIVRFGSVDLYDEDYYQDRNIAVVFHTFSFQICKRLILILILTIFLAYFIAFGLFRSGSTTRYCIATLGSFDWIFKYCKTGLFAHKYCGFR